MPAYTGPDRYCRICHTLLSHLESGVCIVHMRDDARRSPDDAVMLATEELREALGVKAKNDAMKKLPPYLTVYALDHAHEMGQLRLLARDARNEGATRKRKARFPTMYLP